MFNVHWNGLEFWVDNGFYMVFVCVCVKLGHITAKARGTHMFVKEMISIHHYAGYFHGTEVHTHTHSLKVCIECWFVCLYARSFHFISLHLLLLNTHIDYEIMDSAFLGSLKDTDARARAHCCTRLFETFDIEFQCAAAFCFIAERIFLFTFHCQCRHI